MDRVYTYKHFILVKKSCGFIAINTRGDFDNHHSHVKTKTMGIQLIKNVANNRPPKTRNLYLLESHYRLSTDVKYRRIVNTIKTCIEYDVPLPNTDEFKDIKL